MKPFEWDSLDDVKYRDEKESLRLARERMVAYPAMAGAIEAEAIALVERLRRDGTGDGPIDAILGRIGLSSDTGRALMRICEAFGRSTHASDRQALIREQLSQASPAELAKAGLAGRLLGLAARTVDETGRGKGAAALIPKPLVALGVRIAISRMASQFVVEETIGEALERARKKRLLCSFDMLGEGARTLEDADRYEADYARAIAALSAGNRAALPETVHGVSVKLSALDCRYEATKEARAFQTLYPRLERLMLKAAAANIDFYIDAEEADRLVLSLKLFDRLERAAPPGWDGLGLAVQAYQRRAIDVVDRLIAFAEARGRRIKIRLVKGAYWDGEIKKAQVAGSETFPVFTSKPATDISYLACAEVMLTSDAIYPAFATHNAHTVAAVRQLAAARPGRRFEFQRLHGMGRGLHEAAGKHVVRVYAPVGRTNDLLPYLVRRLLENGANSSFVSKLRDLTLAPAEIASDPVRQLHEQGPIRRLRDPGQLFDDRTNSVGYDLTLSSRRAAIESEIAALDSRPIAAASIVRGEDLRALEAAAVRSPADQTRIVGTAVPADAAAIDAAFTAALEAQPAWDRSGGRARAEILRRIGDGLESSMPRLVALLAREAGKTLADAVSEVREAIDFCHFYAASAEKEFEEPVKQLGPNGEKNNYSLQGRGIFVCISPWNFPLAIFVGQIAAALAAGNSVIAKPAPQTPLIAYEAIRIFLASGLDPGLVSLLIDEKEGEPHDERKIGPKLVKDVRLAGVSFTGSTHAATSININLAHRKAPIARLIAETGGLNAIFADETALPEQLVDDVLVSAFGAAGQRCSSARFLFVPESRGEAILHRLENAMAELTVGDPTRPEVEVGPLIDARAKQRVQEHIDLMRGKGCRIIQAKAPREPGLFMPPIIIEIRSLDGLDNEVFGPVLHVLTYPPGGAGDLARTLRGKGYALTLGIHTRLKQFEKEVAAACPAGNIYVNRSTVGAVVGVQPFGGFGNSGTGPKAGGPHSLYAYADEVLVSENTMAKGGDLDLINQAASAGSERQLETADSDPSGPRLG